MLDLNIVFIWIAQKKENVSRKIHWIFNFDWSASQRDGWKQQLWTKVCLCGERVTWWCIDENVHPSVTYRSELRKNCRKNYASEVQIKFTEFFLIYKPFVIALSCACTAFLCLVGNQHDSSPLNRLMIAVLDSHRFCCCCCCCHVSKHKVLLTAIHLCINRCRVMCGSHWMPFWYAHSSSIVFHFSTSSSKPLSVRVVVV